MGNPKGRKCRAQPACAGAGCLPLAQRGEAEMGRGVPRRDLLSFVAFQLRLVGSEAGVPLTPFTVRQREPPPAVWAEAETLQVNLARWVTMARMDRHGLVQKEANNFCSGIEHPRLVRDAIRGRSRRTPRHDARRFTRKRLDKGARGSCSDGSTRSGLKPHKNAGIFFICWMVLVQPLLIRSVNMEHQ